MKNLFKTTITVVATALILTGCTAPYEPVQEGLADGPNVLRVLAGSEVKDMAPIVEELKNETGVELVFDYTGTLDGTENVASGATTGSYDATWFPSNRYLALLDGGEAAIKREEKIMSSPVVLGVKEDVASKLGWNSTAPTWAQIVDAVQTGEFTYGMTSPFASNSGFATLIEAATALSGTGVALTPPDVENVSESLTTFAKGQTITSGSSGWLADTFTADPTKADGIFNYESVLKTMTVDGKPLTIVAPSDGVITADYPFSLLASAAPEKEELYKKAVDFLMEDTTQEKIKNTTNRRTTATTASEVPTVFELPFPNQLETVQKLINTYISDIKKPSDMVFTIDTSGSMDGARIIALKEALTSLTTPGEGSKNFLTFQNRETITYVNFASGVKDITEFSVQESDREATLTNIQSYIGKLEANGGTSIYTALETSFNEAVAKKKANPDNFVSVVLFSDGENMEGLSYQDFMNFYNQKVSTDKDAANIPAFVILFGEGNVTELTNLANTTGGKLFDANKSDLISIFKEIRGYQ